MIYLAAAIVLAALVAMASGRVPAVLALAGAISVAGLAGIAPPSALFAGLSNGGVITVAAMLVIAKGVIHTGVVSRVTWRLLSTVTTAAQTLQTHHRACGRGIVIDQHHSDRGHAHPRDEGIAADPWDPRASGTAPHRPRHHSGGLHHSGGHQLEPADRRYCRKCGGGGQHVLVRPGGVARVPGGLGAPADHGPTFVPRRSTEGDASLDWRVEIPVAANAIGVGRLPSDVGIHETRQFALLNIRRRGDMLEPTQALAAGDTLVFKATEAGRHRAVGQPPFRAVRAAALLGIRLARGTRHASRSRGPRGRPGDRGLVGQAAAKDRRREPGETVFVTCESPQASAGSRRVDAVAGRRRQSAATGSDLVGAGHPGRCHHRGHFRSGAGRDRIVHRCPADGRDAGPDPSGGRPGAGLERAVHPGRIGRAGCHRGRKWHRRQDRRRDLLPVGGQPAAAW